MSFAASRGRVRALPSGPTEDAPGPARAGATAGRAGRHPGRGGRGGGRGQSPAQAAVLAGARAAAAAARAARAAVRPAAQRALDQSDHLDRLRATFRERLGSAGRGARVTEMQAAVMISAFLLYNSDGSASAPLHALSQRARARVAAFLTGRDERTAEKLWALYQEHGRIVLEEPGVRGTRRPNEAELLALEPRVKEHVREVLLQRDVPCWVTRRSLQALIRDASGIDASFRTVSRLCAAWGLEYGRLRRPAAALTPKRRLQRDVAICQVRLAIAAGHTLLAADESFCNSSKAHEDSFHIAGSPFASFARARSGRGLGERLCFIQAVGEQGLCGVPEDLPGIVGDIETRLPTAEVMFAAKRGVGEFHGNFSGSIFLKFLLHRFIPWALARYPDLATGPPGALARKLCLMLDNAPYHTASSAHLVDGEDLRFNPLTSTKKVLFEGMERAGCKALVVVHSYAVAGAAAVATKSVLVPMTAEGAAMRGRAGVFPGAEEVKVAAQQWLMLHRPSVLENDAEAAVRKGLNGNAYILWNAPNFPELMPIEFVWAQAKAYVGAAWTGRRSMAVLAHDVHMGLYTDAVAMPGVLQVRGGNFVEGADGACPAAAALFAHVLRSPKGGARAHIAVSERLRGTIDDLVVPGELEEAVAARGRNAMLYRQAQLLEAQAGEALGEALEEESEEEGGEEDEEEAGS